MYVREIARVKGKPTVVSQVYIGSPQRVLALAAGAGGAPEEKQLKVQEFGALFLAQLADRDIDVVGIVDSVVGPGNREKGPTIGEYFLYATWNRMIEAVSKERLAWWYEHTAVQQIRPVVLSDLSSERYWDKWDRVSEESLQEIARRFFRRLWHVEQPRDQCLLFDTTNYYTYLATHTESDLAKRTNSKDSKSHLRQIGLALLVDRGSRLPLFYREYPGNVHDSKQFGRLMNEMFAAACELNPAQESLTVVIDKGMNSPDNIRWLDQHPQMHFVTTYSPAFVQDLVLVPPERFTLVEIEKNRWLEEAGQEQLTAFRTRARFWDRERTVVVTHNPETARKQGYNLDRKLELVHQRLSEMRVMVAEKTAHWRNPAKITARYQRLCQQLHLPLDLYQLSFSRKGGQLALSFQVDIHRIARKKATLGKNIIVTDRDDWSTEAIIQAHLDRWQVEDCFRQSKDDTLVNVRPMRHWTDSKIRCHLFTCVVALTYLRRLERKLAAGGMKRTADDVMGNMRNLHSILSIRAGAKKPGRRLETPSKTQSEILAALGYQVDECGVLQSLPG